jgi:hypothetical protein
MRNELDRIAKRHKGLGLLQSSNTKKRTFDQRMESYGLEFWLMGLVAFVGFLAVISLVQALALMLE